MKNVQIYQTCEMIDHEEIAYQQQTMIAVFRQEILRLQDEFKTTESQRDQYRFLYEKTLETVQILKEKISELQNNNQCLRQTLQVFHKEFIKSDHNNIYDQGKRSSPNLEKPFFQQLIHNIKNKFNSSKPKILKMTQRSYFSDHYGLFLHEQLQECQFDLFRDANTSKRNRCLKIKNYGKKYGFNEKFRHVFWSYCIQNSQKITYQHFKVLSDAFDHNPETSMHSLIELDLKRMDLKIHEEKSKKMKKQIKKCLQLFTLYRPDIGYIQGMSYFAWMLLIRMRIYEAFTCFSNIVLNDPFIHCLYFFQKQKIDRIINFFEECLEDKKPKLFHHFRKLQVQSQFFIYEWAYTFFTRAFNLRIVSKIWDLWFSEGFNVFFKVTMTIMEMLQPQLLLQRENNEVIDIIRNQTYGLDENQFFRLLSRQRLFENLNLNYF